MIKFKQPQKAPNILDIVGMWYDPSDNDDDNLYLHTDGQVHFSALNSSGKKTGYFPTREKARQAITDFYDKIERESNGES